jgi:acyl-coenzyme A thioesterase PaaI-like protein
MSADATPGVRAPWGYPPEQHLLRDLGLWIERDAEGSRGGLPVAPGVCTDRGCARAGVLATLVDLVGGESALRMVQPDWVATSDLVMHVTRPVRAGEVEAHPALLRRGRSTAVIEVELREAGSAGLVGLATMTFAVLPARSEEQRAGLGPDEPRTGFGRPGQRLEAPVGERMGARLLDASQGAWELPLSGYVTNSLGALQGGAVATLVDLSAESAARAAVGEPWITTDLAVHYLSLGKRGPIRSRARLLRRDAAGAVARVEVRDAGAEDRLTTVATVTVEPFG